ncbi:hypothetical protein [Qipengyuania nanhaisediminis]|uniref:hypothetical protein n=1 Tax=Qipengyuania nanhaisediminis TaxID=604088 RepID=UPI0038B34170
MTDEKKVLSQEERQSHLAPETHNDEQDDHRSQAQEVAEQAVERSGGADAPTEGLKVASPSVDGVAGSETDVIDEMREMEDSGKIDNGAYAGEPNHDDNTSKFIDQSED